MPRYSIELDCAPGAPRPNKLLPRVLKNTGIEPDELECVSKMFGNWVFEVPESLNTQYEKKRETIKSQVKALHDSGRIRYGSW